MVREKFVENEFFQVRENHGILGMVREIWKGLGESGIRQGI